VSFASLKGGVGKTLISANTAALLTMLGSRVALVDADLGSSSATRSLHPEATTYLNDILSAEGYTRFSGKARYDGIPSRWLSKCTCRVRFSKRTAGSLDMLASKPGLAQADPTLLIDVLLELADMGDYNYIIVDSPPGPNFITPAVLAASDLTAIVTTPGEAAASSASRIATHLSYIGRKAGLVVNHTRLNEEKGGKLPEDVAFTVEVPFDAMAAEHMRRGEAYILLARGSRFSMAIIRLAEKIVECNKQIKAKNL